MATQRNTIHTTVRELESAWGSLRHEWGFASEETADDEPVRFSQIMHPDFEGSYPGQEGEWVVEMRDNYGDWQVVSDERFSINDVDALGA